MHGCNAAGDQLTPTFTLMTSPPYLAAVALAFLLLACSDSTAPAPIAIGAPESERVEIAKALLGTWETIEVDVDYATYDGADTSYRQRIGEADWKRLYGVRPARTVFTPDGKLVRTHILSDGQVVDVTNGLWRARGADSLLVIEPNRTLYYDFLLEGDRLTLSGTVDYDLDGEDDDDYRSVMRLVSRTQ